MFADLALIRQVLEIACRDIVGVGTGVGQESESRDCPARIGTVGNYAFT